jgi:hypothetical protein
MNASACDAAPPHETYIDAAVAIAAVLRNWRRCIERVLSNKLIRWNRIALVQVAWTVSRRFYRSGIKARDWAPHPSRSDDKLGASPFREPSVYPLPPITISPLTPNSEDSSEISLCVRPGLSFVQAGHHDAQPRYHSRFLVAPENRRLNFGRFLDSDESTASLQPVYRMRRGRGKAGFRTAGHIPGTPDRASSMSASGFGNN